MGAPQTETLDQPVRSDLCSGLELKAFDISDAMTHFNQEGMSEYFEGYTFHSFHIGKKRAPKGWTCGCYPDHSSDYVKLHSIGSVYLHFTFHRSTGRVFLSFHFEDRQGNACYEPS